MTPSLGGIVWAFVAMVCAPPSDPEARDLARRELNDSAYQQELPGPAERRSEADAPDGRGRPRRWEPRRGGDPASPSSGGGGFGAGAGLARLLLWVLIGAVVVVLAVGLARAWATRDHAPAAAPGLARAPPVGPAPAAPEVSEAEALARAGRYDEAVHALLLLALHALGSAAGASRTSRTSREVLAEAEATVPAPVCGALGDLVLAVEASRFGLVPTGPEDWAAAADAYRRFAAGRAGVAA